VRFCDVRSSIVPEYRLGVLAERLVGIPILLIGLAIMRFNRPLGELVRATSLAPTRQKESQGFFVASRVFVVGFGAMAVVLGLAVLLGPST